MSTEPPPPAEPVHYLLSTRRMIALAVLVAVIGLVLLLSPDAPSGPPTAAGTPTGAPPTTLAPTLAPPVVASPPAAPPSVPAPASTPTPATTTGSAPSAPPAATKPGGWRPVAEGFASDFTRPVPDWLTRVSKWVTPDLLVGYRTTDPARIPSGHLQSIDLSDEGATTTDVTATYDSGLKLAIRLISTPTGWLVSAVLPLADTAH